MWCIRLVKDKSTYFRRQNLKGRSKDLQLMYTLSERSCRGAEIYKENVHFLCPLSERSCHGAVIYKKDVHYLYTLSERS